LESAFLSGAKQAEAGEFTKRAFLNGKISLTQAEAVIDLIDASSLENIKIASSQSSGLLSGGISKIADEMTDLLSEIYVTADYPDEDLEVLTTEDFLHSLNNIQEKLDKLGETYKAGNAICEGIQTAIVGRPNVGKSTILNSLLRSERAIVSDIPGTTRDTIEETVNIGKIMLRISDTAGIHSTADIIEKKGIERTVIKVENSSLIIAVFDGSEPLNEEDENIISWLSGLNATVLPVVTKSDIENFSVPDLPHKFECPVVFSNKNEDCIGTLCKKISSLFVDEKIDYSSIPVLTNLRQFTLVKDASDVISSAVKALENGISADMIALDVERAHSIIAEVDGRGTAEEITDKIFHRFCVGK
ncbi:MAG: tRNA uridine-5-carboxymethylaminomethyl(34) synthesis GTPase MnmE, partial [Clostridia bacterium]|nr:tRNA uridine-5-carboxymethylaminomethyl(34) synthesis GTPase MnmE [Clostridia bacterium]